MTKEKAKKFNKEKLRYDLIPTRPLMLVAGVYTFGVKKYDADNWRKGLNFSDLIGSAERHLQAFKSGSDLDPSNDNMHHLASLVWASMSLMEYQYTHPELDDRVDQSAAMVSTMPELINHLLDKHHQSEDPQSLQDINTLLDGLCRAAEEFSRQAHPEDYEKRAKECTDSTNSVSSKGRGEELVDDLVNKIFHKVDSVFSGGDIVTESVVKEAIRKGLSNNE